MTRKPTKNTRKSNKTERPAGDAADNGPDEAEGSIGTDVILKRVKIEKLDSQIAIDDSGIETSPKAAEDIIVSIPTNQSIEPAQEEPLQLDQQVTFNDQVDKKLRGLANAHLNTVRRRLIYLESRPNFWQSKPGVLKPTSVEVLEGNLVVRVSNLSGPTIVLNVYEMVDEDETKEAKVLTFHEVGKYWTPFKSYIKDKFRLRRHFIEYKLPGECHIEFKQPHYKNVLTETGATNYICGYLIMFEGGSPETIVTASLSNTITYRKHGEMIVGNLSPWAEDMFDE